MSNTLLLAIISFGLGMVVPAIISKMIRSLGKNNARQRHLYPLIEFPRDPTDELMNRIRDYLANKNRSSKLHRKLVWAGGDAEQVDLNRVHKEAIKLANSFDAIVGLKTVFWTDGPFGWDAIQLTFIPKPDREHICASALVLAKVSPAEFKLEYLLPEEELRAVLDHLNSSPGGAMFKLANPDTQTFVRVLQPQQPNGSNTAPAAGPMATA